MSVTAVESIPRQVADLGRHLQGPLLAAALYYLGAEAAFFVGTLSDRIFAPFWPPNIVLFCALLLSPSRQWWLFVLAAFPAHVFAELSVGMGVAQLLVAFATNCAFALIGAVAAQRLLQGPPWFGTLQKACLYVLITVIVTPMLVAVGGAFVPVMSARSAENYWTFWAQWYLSNAVGSVALGPIALFLFGERHGGLFGERHVSPQIPARVIAECVLLALTLIVVCVVSFESSATAIPNNFLPALIYLPLPFVLWAAIRFGSKGASSAILLVTTVLIWRGLNGPILFLAGSAESNVFAIQTFILGLSIPVLLLGAAIDETRHAEQTVRESEERMAFAAISADVCLWQIDLQTDRLWLTDHGRDMLGLNRKAALTRYDLIGAIHPDDRHSANDVLEAAMGDGKVAECEFRIVRPDDQVRWVRCRARTRDTGALSQVSGTLSDVTERKVAEAEVAVQRQEIAHLTRVSMLSELSGGIAHELTQPLAAILSNAEAARILLGRDPPDITEAAAALDDIIGEDHRAGEVIHRFRGLLKKSETRFEPVDVSALCNSTLQLLHSEMINRRVKIMTDFTAEGPLVAGDQVQLQQVLLNLVLNAMDAVNGMVPSRRILTLSTRIADEDSVEVRIADRGSGLSPADREKLFKPFFTTKEHGLGIGLSLCSSIISLHGGALSLENNAEGGATAAFTLPRQKHLAAT